MQDMPPRDLERLLRHAKVAPVLLDVREAWEFRIVHLRGSILMPLSEVAARIGELDADARIVVICHHGVRSRAAAMLLERHGFRDVINLKGGIDAWARAINPAMPVYT